MNATRRIAGWTMAALLVVLGVVVTQAMAAGVDPALVASTPANPTAKPEVAAASGEQLWWVVWQPNAVPTGGPRAGWSKGVAKLMHAPPEAPGSMRVVAEQSTVPAAITAYADRVWMVFPPSTSFPDRRDVLVRRVEWNPATRLSFAVPPAGELLPSLPADGDLVGFAADARGLWALIAPPPSAKFGVQRDGASAGERRVANLFFYRRDSWVEIPLPEPLLLADGLASGPDGVAVLAPLMLQGANGAADGEPREAGTRLGRITSSLLPPIEVPSWTFEDAPVPRRLAGHVVRWFEAGGRWAFAQHIAGEPRAVELGYWLNGRVVPWAEVLFNRDDWAVGAGAAGAVAVQFGEVPNAANATTVAQSLPIVERSRIGSSSAVADPFVALATPGFGAAYWIHVPLLLMMGMAALMIFAFVRVIAAPDAARQPLDVPALSLDRRIVALLIDVLPPAALSLLVFRVPPSELLYLPSWTIDLPRALPAVMTIVGLCLHTSATEWWKGTTLGKRVAGAAVVSADGSPPRLHQVLLRGAFKALVLAAPILSIFVLFQRDRRGIGDIASGTVVIDTRPSLDEPIEHDE